MLSIEKNMKVKIKNKGRPRTTLTACGLPASAGDATPAIYQKAFDIIQEFEAPLFQESLKVL